jgi:poly(3-hydroxybutyrate) depolymerase
MVLSGLLVLVLLDVVSAPAGTAGASGPGTADAGPPGAAAADGPGPADANRPGPADANRPGPADANRPGPAGTGRPGLAGAAGRAAPAVGGSGVRVVLPSGRTYLEHPPQVRAGARTRPGRRRPPALLRRPLVVALHGWRSRPAALAASSGLAAFADAHGVLLAYGVGLRGSWNAGSCCGPVAAAGVDDVAYLADVVAAVTARHLVDRRRVYVLGFSNGGMMAERAACERPDLFAAAGSVAGPLLVDCASPLPVRFAHIHGLADTTVPYLGGFLAGADLELPSTAALPGLVAGQVPGSTVELVPVAGMGHRWPTLRAHGLDGTATLWALLSRWSR